MSQPLNFSKVIIIILLTGFVFYVSSCNEQTKDGTNDSRADRKEISKEDMIRRGDYIVTTGSCNDCHSPKLFPQGRMVVDSSRLLSGHSATSQLPPANLSSLTPGQWMGLAPDITAFVGPWGISYSSNLTPDSATGIGTWSEQTFINTIRNGKHLGDGRHLLPPMPWEFIGKMTDDDLRSVFAYLKSLPAISNRVPAPVAPPDVKNMPGVK